MKAYGTKRPHCILPGHGTNCEVAREQEGNTNRRSTVNREWQRMELSEGQLEAIEEPLRRLLR